MPDPSTIGSKRIPIDLGAKFLNFNYTPSLQDLYGVPDANILHIHGAARDPDAKLILGHGWMPPKSPNPWQSDPEAADTVSWRARGS
nr:AbiH family protein [Mesorhizobium sp.]